ncbi:MAG TPA: energy transducer TonB [Patescibacteria group bacterium]|nr:energy transducer TonB [Patescibacteria group bacterium]
MFDRLPESSRIKRKGSGKFFLSTGFVYAAVIGLLVVWAILGSNPSLLSGTDLEKLAPPVPFVSAAPPVQQQSVSQKQSQTVFAPPTEVKAIVRPEDVPSLQNTTRPVITNGLPVGTDWRSNSSGQPSWASSNLDGNPPPPPPAVKPKPTELPPTPEATPKKDVKVSTGVLQGGATVRVQPPYPAIAKAARAAGPVQVQVLISEQGRVIQASVLSGHPLLREAALQAAKQWVFNPTKLSDSPVQVQGVLTFNFTLQ